MDKIGRIFVVSVALVIGVSYATVSHSSTTKSKLNEGKDKISLEAPSFLSMDRDGTSFVEDEAGISTYTNVGETIDLQKAKTAFRTIEDETDEYIIGSIPIPDYSESEDVHAYVHKDGWIATYYLKDEPTAKIIDWYDLTSTKLEKGVAIICDAAGVPFTETKNYDFRYSNAERLMVIIDSDSFNLKIPSSFTIYERSYSANLDGSYDWQYGCSSAGFSIDGTTIVNVCEEVVRVGTLTGTQLTPGVFHAIAYWRAEGAIVLTYTEG